jgi:hypothetical protein
VTDAFEEVEENIRRERLAEGVRKYAPIAGAILGLIIVGIIGFEWWRGHQANQAGSYAMEMSKAQDLLQAGKSDEAMKAFQDIAAKASKGYQALALMEVGAIQASKSDVKSAIASYEAAAAKADDPIVRDSAIIRAAYLAAETEPYAAIEARVKPLIDKTSPYAYLARELLGFEAMKAGDPAKARENFEFLTLALDAPEGVRQRAQSAMAMLGPAPAAPAPAPAAAAPAAQKPASGGKPAVKP